MPSEAYVYAWVITALYFAYRKKREEKKKYEVIVRCDSSVMTPQKTEVGNEKTAQTSAAGENGVKNMHSLTLRHDHD